MRKISIFLKIVLFFISFIFCACEKESKNSLLSVSLNELSFDKEGGVREFYIECNTTWSVEIYCDDFTKTGFNDCEWLSLDKNSGSGNDCVKVKVSPTDNYIVREAILVVHTDDGRVTLNVKLRQNGIYFEGNALEVLAKDRIIFDGKSHSTDTIYVMSNILWTIKGPDWLEVSINHRDWINLKGNWGQCEGPGIIVIRTTKDNVDKEDKTGVVVISDDSGELETTEIDVMQPGCLKVLVNDYVAVADGFACNWKYGCDVTSFYVYAFEEKLDINKFNWSDITKWNNFSADKDLVVSWGNLKENIRYEICPIGIGKNSEHAFSFTTSGIRTKTSIKQPLASIENVDLKKNGWEWNTIMNEYATSYYQLVVKDSYFHDKYNSLVAWYIMKYLKENRISEEKESKKWNLQSWDDIHIATWAGNSEVLSGIISRCSSTELDVETRGMLKGEINCVGEKTSMKNDNFIIIQKK